MIVVYILCFLAAACILMFLLLLVLVAPIKAAPEQAAPFFHHNLAHRGLHDNSTSRPENSLAAFRYAVEKGYGAELDVQLTRDGQVVVFHDDTVNRVCCGDGRVDGFTLSELQQFPLCKTDERIPLFTEVLSIFSGRYPLIVELKSTPDYKNLCRRTLDILRAYDGPYCVESFDPRIVLWFRQNAPDIMRGQLSEDYRGWRKGKPWYFSFIMSRVWTNVRTRPQFVAFGISPRNICVRLYRALGGMLVAWTLRPTNDEARVHADYDSVIFEGYQPKVQY